MKLSVVIPALNEAAGIETVLLPLQPWRKVGHEVMVVDGGSADDTRERAEPLADRVLVAPRGRASQMNVGATVSGEDVLCFLHADTVVPVAGAALILRALGRQRRDWGRFDVRLSGSHRVLRVVERLMNLRSRLTGMATGDQAMFVRRALFEEVGGFPDIALMEDIALSQRLKRHGRPACIRVPVTTSSRRWEAQGVIRTIALMWRLRLAYFLGADPNRLALRYAAGARPRRPGHSPQSV